MATGISLLVVFQALLNMASAVGLGPVSGLTISFGSRGGTSLVVTCTRRITKRQSRRN